jgi:bifunctional N-acetylglucosamine-1-phosphate-uridyltransferase/glucosamine-1-phosphate-acetyltransferase GlmU-like protein
MESSAPKPLLELAGRPLAAWVIEAARVLDPRPLVVVASPATRDAFRGVEVAVQDEPTGTGGAVAAARSILQGFDGDVLVLAADTPLVRPATLAALVDEHRRSGAGMTLLSLEPETPLPYGRVLRDETGAVREVVEEWDASCAERAVRELNASIYVFRAETLWQAVELLDRDNAKRELQLTSTVRLLVDRRVQVAAVKTTDPIEVHGVNTPDDLALAEAVLRQRLPLRD